MSTRQSDNLFPKFQYPLVAMIGVMALIGLIMLYQLEILYCDVNNWLDILDFMLRTTCVLATIIIPIYAMYKHKKRAIRKEIQIYKNSLCLRKQQTLFKLQL